MATTKDTQKITLERMAIIFNEWAKRYAENPDEFDDILDEDGNPSSDYGESCAIYFHQLANELDERGQLPRPVPPK